MKKRHIKETLEWTQGDKSKAAKLLGIDRKTIYRKERKQTMAKKLTVLKHGTLTDYKTGKAIRPATAGEAKASKDSARHDGGIGVIVVDGRVCFVD